MPADPGGRVWPTSAQEHLLMAALATDESAPDHFRAWLDMFDIDGSIDEGTYRTLPLLWDSLSRKGLTHPLLPRLKGVFRNSWVKSTRQVALAEELLGAFAAEGVRTLVSKGLPVALLYYAKPALRPMSDLDIMVPYEEAERASAILEKAGFRSDGRAWHIEKPLGHALMHEHPEKGEVDLHWHVIYECPNRSADRHFWDAAVPLRIGDIETLRPSTTDLLLHTLIHGVRWNLSPPLRWIPDAMMILRSADQVDWDRLVAFAARNRVGRRVALGLDYLRSRFDAPIPAEVVASLHRQRSLIERFEILAMRGADDRSAWRHVRRGTYVVRLLGSDDVSGLPRALAVEAGSRLQRLRRRSGTRPAAQLNHRKAG